MPWHDIAICSKCAERRDMMGHTPAESRRARVAGLVAQNRIGPITIESRQFVYGEMYDKNVRMDSRNTYRMCSGSYNRRVTVTQVNT